MTLPSVEKHAKHTVRDLFALMRVLGDADYLGEPVSQLQHSLQCATLAQQAGADDDTVLSALFHDIGHFLPAADKMPEMTAADGTSVSHASHELVGEQYLRELGFSDKICQLVGAHVVAKRYLTAVDTGYYAALSDASKTTLEIQGGVFNEEQVRAAQTDPLLQAKLAVRRWDDTAKDPKMETPDLADFEGIAVASLLKSRQNIELHGRTYAVPSRPTVVVCVDGFEPEYLSCGIRDGILPHMASFCSTGFHATAQSCMPSFTNPNNVSIITGKPPSVHGITGNFFLDAGTGEEKLMNDASYVRGSTILAEMSRVGVRVAAVTAKDKLRKLLSRGLNQSICFSAEFAKDATTEVNGVSNVEQWIGRPSPPQYSADLSLYVLDAGVKLLQEDRADLLYLTLSDFVQHKHAPGAEKANEFMAAIDSRVGAMAALGAVVAVTGDHGMSDKSLSNGQPNVLFLEDVLEDKWGAGSARVICPITDPYVKHHGALGSFVRVYLSDKTKVEEAIGYLQTLAEVEVALPGAEAAAQLDLPLDVEADIVVVSHKGAVIGGRRADHDLSSLDGVRLRSHGGLSERAIPLIKSQPLRSSVQPDRRWKNYDIFDLVLNY